MTGAVKKKKAEFKKQGVCYVGIRVCAYAYMGICVHVFSCMYVYMCVYM